MVKNVKYDTTQIQLMYDTGKSLRQIADELGIGIATLANYSKWGLIETRSVSESLVGHIVTNETRSKLRNLALSQKFGGYQPNAGRSKRDYRIDSDGTTHLLQSSYELLLADLLDSMDIKWIRPDPFQYKLDGKIRNYYPDFLIDGRIYVDTKNDYLARKDAEKINLVEQHNNIKIIILSIKDITEDKITNMLL